MEQFAPIDQIMPAFLDAGLSANEFLGDVALGFFQLVAWMAIFYGALRVTVGADSIENASVGLAGWFIRIFLLGTVASIMLPTILPALIEGAYGIGTGVGHHMTAADFLAPSRLARIGWMEVEKLMKHIMSRSGYVGFFKNFGPLVYYVLASLVILVSFVGIIIMVILSYVYFILEAIGVVITIMGNASEKTAWMGRGGPAALMNRFMHLIMLSATVSIGMVVAERFRLTDEPTVVGAVVVAVVWLIIFIAVFKSEQIGSAVVGGMPGPSAGGTAATTAGGMAALMGAGAMSAAQMVPRSIPGGGGGTTPGNPGTPNVPPTPPSRGGVPQVGSGAQGHAAAPFSPGAGAAAGSSSSSSMSAGQAATQISQQARLLPKGTGDGAEAPTAQQWQDAKIMGTDIVGMTRSQAGAALEAHQGWFMGRGTGSDAAAPSHTGMPASHAGKSAAPASVGAPADWMGGGASRKAADASVASSGASGARNGLGASGGSANPGERPLMRSAAGASVRRTFSPKSGGVGHQVALNSHRNDGRFQIGEDQLATVGQGGGEMGTGYRRSGWQSPSVRRSAIPALTGDNYWNRRDTAQMRQVHLGVMSRQPRAPKSAAVAL